MTDSNHKGPPISLLDVAIDIEVIDETNTRVDVPALLSRFANHKGFGCVALVGVQSNGAHDPKSNLLSNCEARDLHAGLCRGT
ncbi:hypothetical protein [Bradyrhizobium sp. 21]|uniref:hypothetical protein n=1 Tax=Bradyrhizobium sp. 21 TaxID=2782666 RepID=UPI001FF9467E|nr:hypothetical protein [Bradyrhizobium sp. 21]MCK1384630.1 hypothetical protein [Bradyrhizobium sp. 21]